MSQRLRVKLECGHTRELDHPSLRAECWVCCVCVVEAVVGTVA